MLKFYCKVHCQYNPDGLRGHEQAWDYWVVFASLKHLHELPEI